MRAFASVVASLVAASALVAQQPRDVPVSLPPGTGTIAGAVGPDDDPSKPIRGAIVTLNHADKAYADTTITDERGRFAFSRVPAGRYLVSAEKPGYVTLRYGAARPGRAGTPIVLADGERREALQVTLVRGAVLTGTVRLTNGEPAQGAQIQVQRVITGPAGRRYEDLWGHSDAAVDDEGVFRLFGLTEGDYVLQAIPLTHFMSSGSAVLPTRSVDVQWARAQMRTRAAQAGSRDAAPPDRETISLVPVYYPGTLDRSTARIVSVARGEVRAGLDMTLPMVPSYRVSGTVSAPGRELKGVPQIFLVESRPDGLDMMSGLYGAEGAAFTIAGVTPGPYTVMVTVPEDKLFALSEILVASQDVRVSLVLQAGLTVSGRVVFDGSAQPPDVKQVRLHLAPAGTGAMLAPSPGVIKPDWSFTVEGLVPGMYRLVVGTQNLAPWSLREAIVGGQDLAVTPVEITAALAAEPIVATLTDRPTELTGRLRDASGLAASDYFIIVFSTNERAWFQRSRAIAQTRPASDGQFTIRGLPPGDYHLAAVTDVERDEWFDPVFLRELIPASIKLSLAEGRRTVQDVQIRK